MPGESPGLPRGGSPTIMTGAAPPCPQPDETQGMPAKETQCLAENCPRSPWTVVGTGSGLSIQTRAEITSRYARAYAKASKKDKRRGSLTRSGSRGLEPGQRPQRGGRPALRRDGQTDAFLRIAFALRSSRFSASSSPIRSASSPVVPGRCRRRSRPVRPRCAEPRGKRSDRRRSCGSRPRTSQGPDGPPQPSGRPTPSVPRGTSPGALLTVNLPCIHRLHETRGDSRQWHAVETRSNPLMA